MGGKQGPAPEISYGGVGADDREFAAVRIGGLGGLKSVDAGQGSLADQSPFELRDRLVAAGVELTGLRHGESEANAAANEGKPVMIGQSETPLTANGRRQAREADGPAIRRPLSRIW